MTKPILTSLNEYRVSGLFVKSNVNGNGNGDNHYGEPVTIIHSVITVSLQ